MCRNMKLAKHLLGNILIILLSSLISCTDEIIPISVKSVELDYEELTLTIGDSETLTVTINPANAENQNVVWSSSNKAVASVEDGKITTHSVGKATITVTAEDGGVKASCVVTVKEIAVESVTLDRTKLTLTVGGSATLKASVKPDNAANKKVAWSSSNKAVASVNGGKVTAVSAGSATITATTDDGSKKATCVVTVNEITVESVTLNESNLTLTVGESATLTASVKPDNAANKEVTWSSSNKAVASVDGGKVTAISAGSATITATTDDGGKKATCVITVNDIAVKTIKLNATERILTVGEIVTLTATITPENATNKNLVWSSSNESVASVDNGKISAHSAGRTSINVTNESGDAKASCSVYVWGDTPSGRKVWYSTNDNQEIDKWYGTWHYGVYDRISNRGIIERNDEEIVREGEFSGISNLRSIMLSSSVKSIESSAFSGCTNLTNIELPSSLTSIGSHAFRDCVNLASVDLPSTLTSIGGYAFRGCTSLVSVELPSSLTEISFGLFRDCLSLPSVKLPSSIVSLSGETFLNCQSLAYLEISSNLDCSFAFESVGLRTVKINEGVTSISDYAFYGCTTLTSVELPSTLTSVGASAFSGCTSLTSIELPSTSTLTSVGDSAFRDCTSLTSINLPSTLTSVGASAFSGCTSLTSIELPSTLTSIGNYAFKGSGLVTIKIPEGVESIKLSAFYGCTSLTSIELPSTLTSIGGWAFYGCSSLTSIELPSSLTSISFNVFSDCTSLTDVYIRSLTPFYISDPFPTTAKIYVPSESVEAYKMKWTENAAQIVGYDYK